MTKKTTQAQKISASWTPGPKVAVTMIAAGLKGSKALDVTFTSGRLGLKHAIAIDYADPEHVARVSARVAEIKAALSEAGELHSFNVTAGAVPVAEAEVLPELPKADPLQAAK